VEGGCGIVIDPQGMVRYAIHSKATSEFRRQRQHDAIECTLKQLLDEEEREVPRKQGRPPDAGRVKTTLHLPFIWPAEWAIRMVRKGATHAHSDHQFPAEINQ
jgi:hypothetical protein